MCLCAGVLSGSTGDSLEVWRELDLERVEKDLRGVLSRGITSLAVLLLHSYTSVVQFAFVPLRHTGIFTQDPNLTSLSFISFLSFPGHLSEPGTHLTLFFSLYHCILDYAILALCGSRSMYTVHVRGIWCPIACFYCICNPCGLLGGSSCLSSHIFSLYF